MAVAAQEAALAAEPLAPSDGEIDGGKEVARAGGIISS